jgi:hypothetical protein
MLEKHTADERANNTAQLQSPSGEDHSFPSSENPQNEHAHPKKGNKLSSSHPGANAKPHGKPRSNSGESKVMIPLTT